MAQQILKKFIGNDQIDGSKILLSNAQFVRAKKADGSILNVWRVNASDKIEFSQAPVVSIEGTDANSLQTKNQLDLAVSAEASARVAADNTLTTNLASEVTRAQAAEAALQAAVSAAADGLAWKPTAFLISEDAELKAAVEGATVSSILPFSDDEVPVVALSDILPGHFLIAKNGASSKIMKVYDDAGVKKVTFIGVEALASGDTFVVVNDLTDSPGAQENRSIWNFTGSEMIKIGDFDWSLASGIDISASYVPAAGTVAVGDSIEAAIQKIVGNIAAEISARSSADTTLQTNITAVQSNLTSEISRATGAESTLQTNITNEASARTAADGVLQTNINNEAAAREAGDVAIQSDIDAEVVRAQAAEAAEAAARIAADALLIPLSQKGVANGVATLGSDGKVPATQLPSYVDDVLEFANLASFPATGETGKIYIALDTNKQYRWSGSVYVYITSGAVDSVNGETGVVVIDAADIKMLDGTTTVQAKLVSLGSDIAAEASRASTAEGTLQTNISNEASARTSADTTLQNNINSEASTRLAADNALDARIDALETATANWHKLKKTLVAQDITNGYVDLAHTALANSIVGFVDRLGMHKDEDFTVSVVGGVTRITFAGEMLPAGSQPLAAGDSLFFTYQY